MIYTVEHLYRYLTYILSLSLYRLVQWTKQCSSVEIMHSILPSTPPHPTPPHLALNKKTYLLTLFL